jgi:hypothetical protein
MDKRRESDNMVKEVLIMLCKVMQGNYLVLHYVCSIASLITLHNYLIYIMAEDDGNG